MPGRETEYEKMKKVLFIDRDGTLIKEPPIDFQVDSLEKLEFMPAVFRNLYYIRKYTDFELVIVSNQDGMGTPSFPEKDFALPHEKFLEAFANEGVTFDRIHIDPSMPEDKAPTRKPETGMLTGYMNGDYDLAGSFVIGDRETDLQLAKNLACRAIWFQSEARINELKDKGFEGVCALVSDDWNQVSSFLRAEERKVRHERNTRETQIRIELSPDGSGKSAIATGIGFLDHMLDQIARHGAMDLLVQVNGDLEVDEHHTIEDTALALGEALAQALEDKRGLERYGFVLPMDDAEASVSIDLGGRPWLVWEAEFKREKIGEFPTEMFYHFFKSFSDAARCNLHIRVSGQNEHHKAEAIFKAFARALKQALKRDPAVEAIPTTKGIL